MSYTFTPYAVPSDTPSTGYPATYPRNPPLVGDTTVPDFDPAWAAAYTKAKAMIANFTLEQKVNLTTGIGWAYGRCVGNIAPVGNFPGLCLEDSPLGVRFTDFVTAFPAGINVATTWSRALMRLRGASMGSEFVGKGVNVALGPMMNLGRVAEGGRNWEGFGADPFLAGEGAYETILGVQSAGSQATAKHYINNEQEHSRTYESSNVDDRTQHELYAHPFLRSVMAGVASVMCSYNLINNTYACENSKMLDDVMKREFGFQGYIMSDWSAQHSTISAITGLDMTMPGDITFDSNTSYFGSNLTAYVMNNTIPSSRVDDMATRIVAGWYLLGQDTNYPSVNFNAFNPTDPATNSHVNVQANHSQVVRAIGAASAVLLKNTGGLPLNKPRSVAIIGSDARPSVGGPNTFADQGGIDGTLAMGWGSGTANFSYLISPYEAIQQRARLDGSSVNWWFEDFSPIGAGGVAFGKDVAIVFLNSDSGEGYITVDTNFGDRNNLTAWHNGDQLVLGVAGSNNNTIVVVHSVGPLILEPWINHPNVTGVIWAGLPGTESGNGLVDVLYGAYNPSGRLPYTIAKSATDYPTQIFIGNQLLEIPYTEGLLIDYRWFDAKNITPRFEFGFGLSYTTFNYSNLNIQSISGNGQGSGSYISPEETAWNNGQVSPTTAVGASRAFWLHAPAYKVTFDVTNTGGWDGTEIVQLYLAHPPSAGEPPVILKGFDDIVIKQGQTQTVTIMLSKYDLSVWDVVGQGWRRPAGTIMVKVGASSRDLKLSAPVP